MSLPFSLSIGPEPQLLARIAPCIIWVARCFILAGTRATVRDDCRTAVLNN
ncbi:heme exporter protein CcmB [Escherichia coli]|nr:heme exporter protein CcmB [Escherichia coli]